MQPAKPFLTKRSEVSLKISTDDSSASYRGFSSIDQEIEREIALTWFTSSHKKVVSQRNFLLKQR